jgi:hypothetical protein
VLVQALAPAKLGDFIQASALIRGVMDANPGAELQVLAVEPGVLEAQRLLFPEAEGALLGKGALEAGGAGREPPERGAAEATGVPRGADLLVNLSVDPRAVAFAGMLAPKEILGPRPEGGAVAVPPAQKLALAAMALDRRLGRLNLVDVWRALAPGSPAGLCKPPGAAVPGEAAAGLLEKAGGLPLAFFHPGAAAALRRWPAEAHAMLAAALFKTGPFMAVVLGSRRERALALKFLAAYGREAPGAPAEDLTGQTGLGDLWALLGKAALLVSSDTGVMHVGASAGAPQLAVFAGPAYAHETGPYSGGALVLQGLAPCGPCVEGKGCGRPGCRALPAWEAALPLAAALLAGETPAAAGSGAAGREAARDSGKPAPPPLMAWESWETRVGPEGASLEPRGPYPAALDGRSLAALLFREGARALLGLRGRPGKGETCGRRDAAGRDGSEDAGGGDGGPGKGDAAGGDVRGDAGGANEGLGRNMGTGKDDAGGRAEWPGTPTQAAGELALYVRGRRPDLKKVRARLSFIEKQALSGPDRRVFRDGWEAVLAEAEGRGLV